jgi:hypothetical protein
VRADGLVPSAFHDVAIDHDHRAHWDFSVSRRLAANDKAADIKNGARTGQRSRSEVRGRSEVKGRSEVTGQRSEVGQRSKVRGRLEVRRER